VPVAEADAAHLLRRTEFVVRPSRLAELMALPDRGAAVDNVMNFGPNNNPQLPSELQSEMASGWDQYVFACNWWIDQMLQRPRPFQEKMALFWHGHFVSAWWDVDAGYHVAQQVHLYRQNALGSFVDLTQAMSLTPAMLVYLSNGENVKSSPNENFARELLELFTLGAAPGNYSEDDVQAAARAWTGYNYDYQGQQFVYRANRHDETNKTFFGVTRNWNGPEIITEVLVNNVAKRNIAARFIAKKLWDFLAYPNPSSTILDSLAATFANSGMQISPLVRAILTHDEFYSTAARQGLVRTPIEYIVALSFHSGVQPEDLGLSWRAEQTGQQIYQPPNVSGWRHNAYWLNTSAMSGRASFAQSIVWRLRDNGGFDNLYPMSAAQAVDTVATFFGMAPGTTHALSTTTRNALIAAHQAERDTTPYNEWWGPTNLLLMVMMTPEFHMA
jgi:uncharacterized protein (DUF1800 family)